MTKTIFFDLDDTLITHTKAQNKSLFLLKEIHFSSVPQKEFNKIWSEKTKIYWKLFTDKKLSFVEQRNQRTKTIWKHFGKNIDIEAAEKIGAEYLRLYESNWRIFKGVKKYLKLLKEKNIPMGIISNGNFEQQIKKITLTNAIKFFEPNLIIVSESVGAAKPDLEIFKTAQEMAKKEKSDIIYFGNDPAQDIEPAKKMGWQAVLVNNPKNIKEFIEKNLGVI